MRVACGTTKKRRREGGPRCGDNHDQATGVELGIDGGLCVGFFEEFLDSFLELLCGDGGEVCGKRCQRSGGASLLRFLAIPNAFAPSNGTIRASLLFSLGDVELCRVSLEWISVLGW